MDIPTLIPVESSNLASIGYDPITASLFVKFRNGSTYAYSGVPSSIYESLLVADSKGSYLNEQVKNQYPYVKVL